MKNTLKIILLLILALSLFLLDIVYGSISIDDLLSNPDLYHNVIYNFRLPKAITAVTTGAAISVAGLIMQTLFRNPLAGPYVLGVSSGASLGVAIFILAGSLLPAAFVQSGWGLIFSATLGAILVLLLVLAVSTRVKQSVSLLIVGILFGQIAGSLVTILQNASNPDSLKLFTIWTFGSLSAVTWDYMYVMLPIVVIGILIVYSIQKPLNAFLLGENYAISLGINIKLIRFIIILAVALLAGATTAFTGPIAFIGIAVPHLVRGVFHTYNHSINTTGCILVGASLLLLCDVACQLPSEGYSLPINAISSIIGAPIIIWIILRNKQN